MAGKVDKGKKLDHIRSNRSLIRKVRRIAISKKFSVEHGGTLVYLPDEILLKIFHFLDVKSLLACASTCQRWERVASDSFLWKEIYCLHFDQKPPPSSYVEAQHWKVRFLKQAKRMRNRGFLKPSDNRQSCGFAYRAKDHLRRLGNKFYVSLTTTSGKVYDYLERRRTYGVFAVLLQWHELDQFPALKEVKTIEVFSSTPLLTYKCGGTLREGPKQRCLVLTDNQLDQSVPDGPVDTSDSEISCIGLRSGILIGLWKKTNDIAFITASLHTYHLLNKCLLSTSEKIYTLEHVVKHDDVSRFYGLQSYDFHIQVVTGDLHEAYYFQINSDIMKMTQEATTISYRVKDPLRIFAFEEAFLAWKTDLFKGKIPKLAFFTLTAIDFNKDVIFHISQPAKCEELKESTDFDSKSGLTMTCFDELVGNAKLIFWKSYSCGRFADSTTDETFYLDALEMTFNTNFINQWFGTRY